MNNKFEIKTSPTNKNRFAIFDLTGKCIDNANNYGYKSKRNAYRAAYFKFNGGVERKRKIEAWWDNHKDFSDRLTDELFCEWKDTLGTGIEVDTKEIAKSLAESMNINDFKVEYLNYF